jgi:fructose-1-phosphate kinase PfkB-like protein
MRTDLLLAGIVAGLLAGCGLAETATTATAAGASEVQQAQEAKATLDQVKQQVDAAQKADAQRLESAEQQTR